MHTRLLIFISLLFPVLAFGQGANYTYDGATLPEVTNSVIYKQVGDFPYSCLGTARIKYEDEGFYNYSPIEIEQDELNAIIARTLLSEGRTMWKWFNFPLAMNRFIGEFHINGEVYYFGIVGSSSGVFNMNVVKGSASKFTKIYKSYKMSSLDFDFIFSRILYNGYSDKLFYAFLKYDFLRSYGYDTDYIIDTVKIRNSLIKNENSPMSELRKNSF